ncbi:hypothetical protein I4U23_015651 [Adineta vaga]|nr:hypothetical protein I4U23_015651 [Adineta vaga]
MALFFQGFVLVFLLISGSIADTVAREKRILLTCGLPCLREGADCANGGVCTNNFCDCNSLPTCGGLPSSDAQIAPMDDDAIEKEQIF